MNMKWVDELPEQGKTGFYWVRIIGSNYCEKPHIVLVTFDGILENAIVNVPGIAGWTPLIEFAKVEVEFGEVMEWYGPLPFPPE